MKINIAASHRFHVLDLAIQLQKLGHEVTFYSYVPESRSRKYGFENGDCKSFLWIVAPFILLERLVTNKHRRSVIWYRNRLIDWYVSKTMKPCDIFIGLGSIYQKSFEIAKSRYNALTILEWGSKHIVEELNRSGKLDSYPERQLRFDLKQYDTVDYISIASTHVKNSFLKHGIKEGKLIINPYGVALEQFRPTKCTHEFDIIMVGGWSYRKGCDLITGVCEKYGYKLLHVGGIVDLPFPNLENCKHYDPVDQKNLVQFYERAKVFVLPSRTEGLSLVQAQAIACGLPVVCSSETGGLDLRNQISEKAWVIEMPSIDIDCLHESIEQALILSNTQSGMRNYVGGDIEELSWDAYGKRYNSNICNILSNNH